MKTFEPNPGNRLAVIYTRVSSKEQGEGFSIPAQIKLLNEYAVQKGFTVISEFSEMETAKSSGRPQFNEMIKFFKFESRKKNVPACRILLVEKTDRLYRNFTDRASFENLDVEIHFVKENQIISDDSRSHEKLIHGIKVVMSKNYIDNMREEIQKGMKEKAEQGFYPSFAPLGYINVRCGSQKLIQPDPENAPMVKRLFQLYSTGNYSLLELTKKIHAEGLVSRRGGFKISRGTIAVILNNPAYHGEFRWNKKTYKGNYEPIITKDLFEKVQGVLDFKGKTRTGVRKHQWAYQGLITCGNCGCSMVAEKKKGLYVYYRCSGYKGKCPDRYVREEALTKEFESALRAIRLDSKSLGQVVKALKESKAEENLFHEKAVADLEQEKRTLENRIEALYNDKLDGLISKDIYMKKSQGCQDRIQQILKTLEKHSSAHFEYMKEGVQLLELSRNALEGFQKFDMDEKRRIIRAVLSNSIWMNAQLIPKYREPFELIALTKISVEENKEQSGQETDKRNEWCALADSLRNYLTEDGPYRRILFNESREFSKILGTVFID